MFWCMRLWQCKFRMLQYIDVISDNLDPEKTILAYMDTDSMFVASSSLDMENVSCQQKERLFSDSMTIGMFHDTVHVITICVSKVWRKMNYLCSPNFVMIQKYFMSRHLACSTKRPIFKSSLFWTPKHTMGADSMNALKLTKSEKKVMVATKRFMINSKD